MDKNLTLTLKSNNKTLEIGTNKLYGLLDIEGIESADFILNIENNSHYDGAVVISKRIQTRPISITADLIGNNNTDRNTVIEFFNPKYSGVLIVNYCGIEKAIEYEIQSFKSKLVNLHEDLNFIVDLICPFPFFNNIIESKIQIALWKPCFHFPLIIPYKGIVMGLREPSLIVNIINIGSIDSGVIIEFKALGIVSNPSLFNINTREYIKINKSMVAGEIIKINTNIGKKRIENVLNGITTNILNLIDLGGGDTFLQLVPGDNLFRYDADTNINNLEVSIYFNPKYLGV